MSRRTAAAASVLTVLLAPWGLALGADGLSAGERKVVEAIDARAPEALALLERVVNIPSATQNLDGVREVGRVFAAEFDRLGFATRWEEMPAEMGRAGHLIAERAGTRGKRLLLIGHLDTVLEGRKFERKGGRAYGPGACDMKGGDVVLLFALKALHDAGRLDGKRLAVIFTGDEEAAGDPVEKSRASMRELARRSDLALAFESVIGETATVARRGVASWTLKVKGPTGHSAGIFGNRLGPGAVFEAARVLDAFRRELPVKDGLTYNPSLVLAGTEVDHTDGVSGEGTARGKRNVVPGSVVVEGDLRFVTNPQRDAAEKTMRAILAQSLPRTSAELTFDDGEYPAMAPTPANYAILSVLDRASRDLGLGSVKPLDPAQRGAGDISFVAPLLPGLDGLGARGERAHSPDEWVDLDSIPAQVRRAALLIDRLTSDDPAPGAGR
jgi:glutamate carboxypeptidase